MDLTLTLAQERIWRAIADYLLEKGYPPAYYELEVMTGHSRSVINYSLERLAQKGYITLAPKNQNGYRPARSYQMFVWPMEIIEKAS